MTRSVCFVAVLTVACWLASPTAVTAAIITFAAEDFTNTNQLSTSGTLVEAINFGNGSAANNVTANGITFVWSQLSGAHLAVQNASGFASNDLYVSTPTVTNLSETDARSLFRRVVFGLGADSNLMTLSGLDMGTAYEFQLLMFDGRAASNGRTITASQAEGGTPSIGPLNFSGTGAIQLITGTFTANATTQQFDLSATSSNNAFLSAYQLRAIPVPEPGTVVLSMTAIVSVGMLRRYRRLASKQRLANS